MVLGVPCRSRGPLLVGDVQVFHTTGPGLGEKWSRYLSDSEKWLFIHSLKNNNNNESNKQKNYGYGCFAISDLGVSLNRSKSPSDSKEAWKFKYKEIVATFTPLSLVLLLSDTIWCNSGSLNPPPTPSPPQIFLILYCLTLRFYHLSQDSHWHPPTPALQDSLTWK